MKTKPIWALLFLVVIVSLFVGCQTEVINDNQKTSETSTKTTIDAKPEDLQTIESDIDSLTSELDNLESETNALGDDIDTSSLE